MARKKRTGEPGRIKQFIQAYRLAAQADPKLPFVLLGTFALGVGVFTGIGAIFVNWLTGLILGIGFGVLATLYLFGRRVQSASYKSIEGQPGASAAVLDQLRGTWFVTQAVAANKNMDFVHRVVGRPGVILVAEGPTIRTSGLLVNEKRRTARFVGEIPIIEIVVGNGDGQIPLGKLQREFLRMPKVLRPSEVTALRKRLEAVNSSPIAIPKGPLPKGVRMPKGPR